MFDVWMELLGQVPASVLWLVDPGESGRSNLRRAASDRGADPSRLVFAPRWPYPDYLNRLKLADLFLDTFPFNAGTTASDALWAGLPVVTRVGEAFAARMAASILHALRLPELATESIEQYRAKALQLASQPNELRMVKNRLADAGRRAAVFDTDRFRIHLEQAFETMCQICARGDSPSSFAVRSD